MWNTCCAELHKFPWNSALIQNIKRTTFTSCLFALRIIELLHRGITASAGTCVRQTQCMSFKSHQLWCSRLLDFLVYLKDQVLGWYLNVVLGFMEAYFLLALVPHKSQLICCFGFLGEAFRWHWSKWNQTTNTNKGVTLSIANVWAGLPLSDLLLLTSRSLHKFQIYLSGLDPGSYWPTRRFRHMNTLGSYQPSCANYIYLLELNPDVTFCHRFPIGPPADACFGNGEEIWVCPGLPRAGAFPRSTAPHRVRLIRPGE